jgi:hypothetical protein
VDTVCATGDEGEFAVCDLRHEKEYRGKTEQHEQARGQIDGT